MRHLYAVYLREEKRGHPRPRWRVRYRLHSAHSYDGYPRSPSRRALALAEWARRAADGSIRRECLDHMIVSGEAHLNRILKTYASYYNEMRTHLSLDKDAPKSRRSQKVGRVVAMPILGGLYHQYIRI